MKIVTFEAAAAAAYSFLLIDNFNLDTCKKTLDHAAWKKTTDV